MGILESLRKFISKKVEDSPDLNISSIMMIDPSILRKKRIEKMIFDLDQTMTLQDTASIPKDCLKQLNIFKTELGQENICFLSNEANPTRTAEVEKLTQIKVITPEHHKPDRRAYEKALEYLKSSPSKTVAMVGDRLWTDILGANKIGLYTIHVRPIPPRNEKLGAFILRSGEGISQKYGKISLINLFLAFLTLSGMGLMQFFRFLYSLFTNTYVFNIDDINFLIINGIFLFIANVVYWFITLSNLKSLQKTESVNAITLYFNTYPLFLRYTTSWLLFILSFIYKGSLPHSTFILAQFYSFSVNSALILSLSSYYHSDIGRALRILGDISIIIIISMNIPYEWIPLALLLPFVPVGIAAKYYGWIASIVTSTVCGILAFYVFPTGHFQALIYSFSYFMFILVLKVDSKEATNPIDRFFQLLDKVELKNIKTPELLKLFATVMNCEAIYYIKPKGNGYFFLKDQVEEIGEIPRYSNEELSNYLKFHPDNIINNSRISSLELMNKQRKLLADFRVPTLLRPPSIRGIKSVLVIAIPRRQSEYLIFTNNFTRNGVTRRRFSISHARTANICSITLSNHT